MQLKVAAGSAKRVARSRLARRIAMMLIIKFLDRVEKKRKEDLQKRKKEEAEKESASNADLQKSKKEGEQQKSASNVKPSHLPPPKEKELFPVFAY